MKNLNMITIYKDEVWKWRGMHRRPCVLKGLQFNADNCGTVMSLPIFFEGKINYYFLPKVIKDHMDIFKLRRDVKSKCVEIPNFNSPHLCEDLQGMIINVMLFTCINNYEIMALGIVSLASPKSKFWTPHFLLAYFETLSKSVFCKTGRELKRWVVMRNSSQ